MDIDANSYRSDGFMHIPGFFNPEEVRAIHLDARRVFTVQLAARDILADGDVSDEHLVDGMETLFKQDLSAFMNCGKQAQHLISLHRLSLDNRIVEALGRLGLSFANISTRPVLYFNSPRLAKKEVYWRVFPHQDWRSMQGSLDAVVVWLPLTDIGPELGPLEVIPGSHRDGLVTSGVEDGFGRVGEDYLDGRMFVPLDCRLGDAVFFSAFLVHRSGTNVTNSIRWSCHFRYNNLLEPTFIERGYPHPYLYKPQEELLTPGFPQTAQVRRQFESEGRHGA